MDKLINYVKLSKLELTKVIFPLKLQIRQAFITVLMVVTVITLFLAAIDALMSFSISSIIG
jgi:preprotein translocase subunit SecE